MTVIKATPPLGPVQGKAPIIFALPALVGHRDRLREQLPEAFRGRPDAVFLIPVTNDKNAVVWRVFWEKGAIKLIEECARPHFCTPHPDRLVGTMPSVMQRR